MLARSLMGDPLKLKSILDQTLEDQRKYACAEAAMVAWCFRRLSERGRENSSTCRLLSRQRALHADQVADAYSNAKNYKLIAVAEDAVTVEMTEERMNRIF
jgi:hypothetical protein